MTVQSIDQSLSDLVAENIRALLARTRIHQQELADALGMTQGAVSKKVNGARPFTIDEMQTAAELFGVPVASLLEPPQIVPFAAPPARGTQHSRRGRKPVITHQSRPRCHPAARTQRPRPTTWIDAVESYANQHATTRGI